MALLAPLVAFLPALGDVSYLHRTVASSWSETEFTLLTSTQAALIALLLAVGPAIELARGGQRSRMLWAACLLPFLLPPALTGIGLIALWSPVRFVDFYGSPAMTVAAELARYTPVSVAVLATWFLRTDPAQVDAAIVTGTSLRRIVCGVLIPLATPGLAAAAGLVFVLSLGEIGANLLVTPAGFATLTMKTYNYLHYGGSQAAAGLCLLLVALAALGAILPALAVRFKPGLKRS
jgi:iron(III) transport system permease protein